MDRKRATPPAGASAVGQGVLILLVTGIGLLTIAHLINAVTYESPLLDFDLESNLPTWYSSSVFLVAALTNAGAAIADRVSRGRVAFAFVTLLALVFSVDETAALHEHAGNRLGAETTLSMTQPTAALIVVVALMLCRQVAPRRCRTSFVVASVLLIFSQTCASIAGLWLDGPALKLVETAEDATETLTGIALLAIGLSALAYCVDLRPRALRNAWRAVHASSSEPVSAQGRPSAR